MSWQEIKPSPKTVKIICPVFAGSNGCTGRFAQWFEISFDGTAPDLAWLKCGVKVKVEIGAQEDAARIRVSSSPQGPFIVCKSGATSKRLRVRLPALPGQSRDKQKKTGLAYRALAGGGSLSIFRAGR
jgi:hypothetical protein